MTADEVLDLLGFDPIAERHLNGATPIVRWRHRSNGWALDGIYVHQLAERLGMAEWVTAWSWQWNERAPERPRPYPAPPAAQEPNQ